MSDLSINKNLASLQRGYHLSLSDGSQWHLNADESLRPWLDKFAAIMKLNKSSFNGSPRLTYTLNPYPTLSQSYSGRQTPLNNNSWDCTDLKFSCVWFNKDTSDVICKLKFLGESNPEDDRTTIEFLNMWNALFPIYRQSVRRGGIPFHAALVEKKGAGVLLAAPGDTGKSTCCRRLPDDWKPLCDDETLVVLDNEKGYRGHPFPTWSDYLCRESAKTWDIQHSVLLCGVFFFEQSDTDEATALGQGEAAAYATRSAAEVCEKLTRRGSREFQRTFRKQIFNNAYELLKDVPAFRLRISLNGKFWEKIEQVLGWHG